MKNLYIIIEKLLELKKLIITKFITKIL